VVGHDDAVHTGVGGASCVVDVLDALQHDGAVPVLAQERQLVPAPVGAGEHRDPLQDGRGQVLLRRLREQRPERRVGERDRVADPADERQVGLVQVVGPPGERPRVECDDERREPGRLGPLENADRDVVVLGPVELVPARPVPVGLGDLFDGVRRRGGEHHRQPDSGGGTRGGQLAVRVHNRLHADRREQHGRRHRLPEHGGGEITTGGVGEHPRHDPPPPERLTIRGDRRSGAGAANHISERAGGELLPRERLEPGRVGGERGQLVAEPLKIDLVLVPAELHSHAAAPRS
jgi:hypothetical protein